jgi:hypothetical protein
MSKRKKIFPCGHKGYGRVCHRCVQQEIEIKIEKETKQDWLATFAADRVDLRQLPKNVVVKARHILQGLAEHRDYREFHGKRLHYDRHIISIPVTRNYRLICCDRNGSLTPEAVISHEDYNVAKPRH